MVNNVLNFREFISIAVDGTAIRLADYLPSDSRWSHAYIGVKSGSVRWLSISDQEPTASKGNYVNPGGSIDWTNPEIDYRGVIMNAKFVKAGTTSAELEVNLAW